MIRGFACKDTARLFDDGKNKRFAAIKKAALLKLDMLHAAHELVDLRVPPGNRLEALKGEREGQHSIRINRQWRICFVWRTHDALDVEITDYH